MEYCHGHASPKPMPVPAPQVPIPIPPPANPATGIVAFHLTHQEATTLAAQLAKLSTTTTIMTLQYQSCLPTPLKKLLPKGWVYDKGTEGVKIKELSDPNAYLLHNCPLTHVQHQLEEQYHCNFTKALPTTSGLTLSPSPSLMSLGGQLPHALSVFFLESIVLPGT